jgi:hypothetical protein
MLLGIKPLSVEGYQERLKQCGDYKYGFPLYGTKSGEGDMIKQIFQKWIEVPACQKIISSTLTHIGISVQRRLNNYVVSIMILGK